MNFLAGFLLLWLQEEQAFWMLVYLVEDVLLDYFGRSMIGNSLSVVPRVMKLTRLEGSLVDTKVFLDLLQRSLPKLFARLQSQGFPFSAITTNWLCCVFVNSLPKKVGVAVLALVRWCLIVLSVCRWPCESGIASLLKVRYPSGFVALLTRPGAGVHVMFLVAIAIFMLSEEALLAEQGIFSRHV
jgi:hypothetical protein